MTFSERRVLHEYPRGAHRWTLLLLTVLATILASYEFQLSPLLPLLLPAIHLSQDRLRLLHHIRGCDRGDFGITSAVRSPIATGAC